MKTHTKSVSKLTYRTSLMPDAKATDGGKALLIEAFDFIRGAAGRHAGSRIRSRWSDS